MAINLWEIEVNGALIKRGWMNGDNFTDLLKVVEYQAGLDKEALYKLGARIHCSQKHLLENKKHTITYNFMDHRPSK